MITICAIQMTDLVQYAALCDELFGEKTNMTALTEAVRKIRSNTDYLLIGAKDENGALLGAVMGIVCIDTVGRCRPFMVLENLIVSERYHRLGIGKRLVENLEKTARERNCYFIMLMSLMKRKEAHLFYEALGYSKNIAQGFKKYL